MNYVVIIILFIIIFLFLYIKITSNVFIEFFDIDQYKSIMLNNNKKNLYNIKLSNNDKIYTENCNDMCDNKDCIKLYTMKKNLNNCLKCQSENNKCFKKSIIGGVCNDCDEEDKIDCFKIDQFGCTNPKDLQSYKGVSPYFIQVNDDNVNSPFDKKCVFCWNILDNI